MHLSHICAGVIMFAISSIGVLANSYVFVNIVKRKTFRTSFYFLCASKAFSNLLICLAFLGWSTPYAFGVIWIPEIVGIFVGIFIGSSAYLAGVLSQLASSVNRFLAAFFSNFYTLYCGVKSTSVCHVANTLTLLQSVTVALWIVAALSAVAYLATGISYVFDPESLVWTVAVISVPKKVIPNDTEILNSTLTSDGATVSISLVVYSITAVMFAINGLTFVKLMRDTVLNNFLSSEESKRRLLRSRVLFAQKVSQDSLYLIDMLNLQVISGLSSAWWWTFCTNSLVWLTLSTVDGIVMITFNKELLGPLVRYVVHPTDDGRTIFVRRRDISMAVLDH